MESAERAVTTQTGTRVPSPFSSERRAAFFDSEANCRFAGIEKTHGS